MCKGKMAEDTTSLTGKEQVKGEESSEWVKETVRQNSDVGIRKGGNLKVREFRCRCKDQGEAIWSITNGRGGVTGLVGGVVMEE